jgi:hypothetical protein
MDAKSLLLTTALQHRISEPNIEAGFERFRSITDGSVDYHDFCEAIAACLRESLIREPVRLPEGALQCHWRLELTPEGVAGARAIVTAREGRPTTSPTPPQREAADGRPTPGPDDGTE